MSAPLPERLRLDLWLWYARFFRTRSLATKAVTGTGVRVDGVAVKKAHHALTGGEVLTFVQARQVRVVKVLALATRRGGAPEAQALYEDLKPPVKESRLPREIQTPAPAGRPDRRARRQLDRLKRGLE